VARLAEWLEAGLEAFEADFDPEPLSPEAQAELEKF
jgi:hypothetical protein